MKRLIAEAMEQGAVGLTSAWHGGGFSYPEELLEMARVAAGYGGYYGTHVGSEGFELEQELEQAIRVGENATMPVHVYHLKIRGKPKWGKVDRAIEMIEAARSRGLDVTANQYPYTAMQHPWHRLLPRWVQDMPPSQAIEQFRERSFRDRVEQDPEFRQYIEEHGGWEGIVGSRFTNEALKDLEGKTVAEIAASRDTDPLEACFDLITEEGGFPFGVYHNMSEDDVKLVMRQPWVSIASDGAAVERASARQAASASLRHESPRARHVRSR